MKSNLLFFLLVIACLSADATAQTARRDLRIESSWRTADYANVRRAHG